MTHTNGLSHYGRLIAAFLSWVIVFSYTFTASSSEWDKVVAAAKKEGQVVIAQGGGSGTELRRYMTQGFQKEFPGIKVDLTIAGGRSIAPKILMERRVGRYLWDVYTGGTTTALTFLVPAGVLDPIMPALILPEVKDPSKWFGGQLDFSDNAATYNLVFGGYVKPPLVYNTKQFKKGDVRSYKDLLDPKWRGKIVMTDPRRPGTGLAAATFWYGTPELGKEFMRQFFTRQEVRLSRDYRQQLEWLARGDFTIAIGHHNGIYTEFVSKGLPLGQLTAEDVKEANYVTAAVAGLGLVNRAPHPNAARVFINWFLTKEVQTKWSRMTNYWSRRLDVPNDHLDPALVPREDKISTYQMNYKEEWVKKRREIVKFLRTVIK